MLIWWNSLSNDKTHFHMHKGLICNTTMKCDVKYSSFQIWLKLAQNNSHLKLKLLYIEGVRWAENALTNKWGNQITHDLHINNQRYILYCWKQKTSHPFIYREISKYMRFCSICSFYTQSQIYCSRPLKLKLVSRNVCIYLQYQVHTYTWVDLLLLKKNGKKIILKLLSTKNCQQNLSIFSPHFHIDAKANGFQYLKKKIVEMKRKYNTKYLHTTLYTIT